MVALGQPYESERPKFMTQSDPNMAATTASADFTRSMSTPATASSSKSSNLKKKMSVSYETFAPRSAAQLQRLSRLAALTAGPSATQGTANDAKPSITLWQAMTPPSLPPTQQEILQLTTTDDPVKQTLEKTYRTSDHMTSTLKHTTSMRLALRASINIAEDISNRHAELLRHSGELSAAADRLQAEETMLSRHAEEIGMPLKHYDAVDRIGVLVGVLFKGKTVVRGLAKLKVDNDDFSSVLDEIDNAVEFFGNESGGREALQAEMKRRSSSNDDGQLLSGSIEYYRRALALQEAALSLIREAVADRISQTTSDVAAALNIPKVPIAADKLEASLVYTRFHGISSRSNRLLALVRKRLNQGETYSELLQLCRNTYCGCRETLLKMTIRAHMDKLKDQHGLVGMTRLASVFLIRICTVETSLYLDFFGDKKKPVENNEKGASTKDGQETTKSGAPASSLASQVMADDGTHHDSQFQAYLGTLCSALHRTVRRGLVTILDLDTLCQIVSVLREERSMASSSPTTMAAARAIASVIADSQERLIFCANTALAKEVIRYKATPSDLDYPNKLRNKMNTTSSDDSATTSTEEDAVQKQLQVYESWFPPMRSVLKILSKIFRVVENRVFEDIARDSVQACTRCLKEGSAYIQQKSGVRHADLFLVKHLLILREQLSPFDIELRSVERQLDFSDAGKAVSRFLANRNRRLFSMSTENALITLLREGVSVQESSVDSKRDLEDSLRSACNDFIEHTSSSIAKDLFCFCEQCKSCATDTLKGQHFISSETVQSMLSKTAENLEVQIDDITTQMGLYLDNPATQSILLKPVSRKITRSLDEARRYIGETIDGENGWDADVRAKVVTTTDDIESSIKKVAKISK